MSRNPNSKKNNNSKNPKKTSASGMSSNSFHTSSNSHHQPSFVSGNQNESTLPAKHNISYNMNSSHYESKILDKKPELTETFISKVDCTGEVPPSRFGHSIVLINQVKLILFGGAVGNIKKFDFSNETYIFNLMTKMWLKVIDNTTSPRPTPRAAHAAATNDSLQMVIHGGSIGNSLFSNDELWLFDLKSKDEDSTWSLIPTIGKSPGKRYGHTLAYMKPYFVLLGGNLNPELSNDVWIIDINTPQIAWTKLDFQNDIGPSPRLYHTCGFAKGNAEGMMIVFGGRDSKENPLNDIWGLRRHRDGRWDWMMAPITKGEKFRPRYNHSVAFFGSLMIVIGGRTINSQGVLPIEVYDTEKSESFEFPGLGLYRQSSFIFDDGLFIYGGFNDKNPYLPLGNITKVNLSVLFEGSPLMNLYIEINQEYNENSKTVQNQSHISKLHPKKENTSKKDLKYKLAHEVVVGAGQNEEGNVEDTSMLFRKISIDKLQEENKRIGQEKLISSIQSKRHFNYELITKFIETLLRPFDWYTPAIDEMHQSLPFTEEEIRDLIKEVKPILEKESSLPKIRSPCKIFGNLYGEYNDLMRFFESFGNPSDDNQMGDIHVMQYLFLGDFCDRGFYSLEVVFLLFALKVKYPEYIYIIRGHHEDININCSYGLGQECKDRLYDNISKPNSIFNQINSVFEYLPLGILIDNQILCVHGGIGSSLTSLSDIENIKRPVKVIQEVSTQSQQLILDILWSEYSNDIDTLAVNEERDKSNNGFILKYGKDRLNKFLNDNKLNLLITSHQLVQGGFQTFNDDRLLTVFSATHYMDKYKNDGGMIIIAKKTINRPMNIMPKLINAYDFKKECYRKNKSPSPFRNIINK